MDKKIARLKNILKEMGSVLVAYSGGVDSTFLLKVARDNLKDKVLAVTADSPTYLQEELAFAKQMAKALAVKHITIKTDELKNKRFVSNPVNRCYLCKRELFSRLKHIAKEHKLDFVIDASNLSDREDFRPGDSARRQLKIRSPLQEAGIGKEDIRKLSEKMGLSTWNKPSLACLASRIPYGSRITPGVLKRINKAESFLKKMGFKQVRLRHYSGLCRIEVSKEDIAEVLRKREAIVENLKRLGYNYVTVDLEGYRSGSMNEVIKK